VYSFRNEDEYEAFHQYTLELQQEQEEWIESEEGTQAINVMLMDAIIEDANEVKFEV
jgi:hypothetical protein